MREERDGRDELDGEDKKSALYWTRPPVSPDIPSRWAMRFAASKASLD